MSMKLELRSPEVGLRTADEDVCGCEGIDVELEMWEDEMEQITLSETPADRRLTLLSKGTRIALARLFNSDFDEALFIATRLVHNFAPSRVPSWAHEVVQTERAPRDVPQYVRMQG